MDIISDIYFLVKYYLKLNNSDSDDFKIIQVEDDINLEWLVKDVPKPTFQQLRLIKNGNVFQEYKDKKIKDNKIKDLETWKIKLVNELLDIICEKSDKPKFNNIEKSEILSKIYI